MSEREFKPLNIAVLVISDSRTEKTDKSGKLLVRRLEQAGHRLHEKAIVPDDVYRIRAAVSRWCADPDVDAVLATGGTGVTGRDGTPEAVSVLFDKEIEGFGELVPVPVLPGDWHFVAAIPRACRGSQRHVHFLFAGLIGRLRHGLGQHHLTPVGLPDPALQPG